MAARTQDLARVPPRRDGAVVYRFPVEWVARSRRAARARHRRRVAAAVGAVLISAAGLVVLAPSGASPAGPGGGVPRTVVVAPGDTLWGIAFRHAPRGTDPRAFVAEVIALNDLDGAGIAPGQRLRLRK